jgi:hypothetical protein
MPFWVRVSLGVLVLVAIGGGLDAGVDDHEAVWVTGVGEVVLATQDVPTAKEQALARARRGAIVEATREERVVSHDMLYRTESPEGYRELFSSLITNEVSGVIVEQERPDYRYEEVAEDVLKLVCTIRARVALAAGDADPGFQVTAVFSGNDRAVFRDGDEMVLRIQATRDCYVTMFGMATDGTVTVLFPNHLMTDNHLEAGEVREVPREEQRSAGRIRFDVELPADRSSVQESIHVVATRTDIPFMSLTRTMADGRRIETYLSTYTAVNEWLVGIPASERASCAALYTVLP